MKVAAAAAAAAESSERRLDDEVAPSGDSLHIQQDRETGVCPPFFGEDMTCMDLAQSYG